MSKRRRDKSRTSENTLINNIISSGARFIASDSDSENENLDEELFAIDSEESENELDSSCVDDTDEDPDFEPSRLDLGLDHFSSDDEHAQPSTSTGRPRGGGGRGRPPRLRPDTSSQDT